MARSDTGDRSCRRAPTRAAIDRRRGERRRHDEELEQVLVDRCLRSVFQPIVDLRTGTIVGVEALARIPEGSRRSPLPWFDRARSAGRAADLDLLALERALSDARSRPPDVYLAVNLSPTGMLDARIQQLLARSEGQVVIEITEHEIVDDYPRLAKAADRARRAGVRIAVDDAGAGWASLRHVLELRPEIIKLDQTLTARIVTDAAARALVLALVAFGTEWAATVLAEGIESDDQVGVLCSLGVGHGQGFTLGRPSALGAALGSH